MRMPYADDKKKIVITGASGFLGRHILKRFTQDAGYKVYALTSRPDELKKMTGGPNTEFLHRDAISTDGARDMLEGAVVIGCAYPRTPEGEEIGPGLKYVRSVFEAAAACNARAVINISSQSVYSQKRDKAATEDTPVCPESTYAVGKYATELMLESICSGSGTAYTSLRMASLIGPGFDMRIVNRFVKQAMDTGKVTIRDNGQKRAFLDVEDAAQAVAAMADSDVDRWKSVYNLGPCASYTFSQIAGAVKNVVERSGGGCVCIEELPCDETGGTGLDSSLFMRDICHYECRPLEESIRKIYEAMSSQRDSQGRG